MTPSSLRSPASQLRPSPAPAAHVTEVLEHVLDRVRSLIPCDAVAFLSVDPRRRVDAAVGRFASGELRDAIEAPGADGAAEWPGLAQIALERDRPLVLPRVEAWEAAPRIRTSLDHSLGEVRAQEVWDSFAGTSVLASPVRTDAGRTLGVLVAASLSHSDPLGTEELSALAVLADLCGQTLERAELLETEARRAREELRLGRAAQELTSTLEPEEVERRTVAQAAVLTGASAAMLTRTEPRAAGPRVVAHTGLAEEPAHGEPPVDEEELNEVASRRAPAIARAEGGTWMHTPVSLGPRVFGILSVAHEDPGGFDHHDLDVLARLGRSAAAAMANAMDFRRQQQITRALTLGFVPESLPEVSGYESGLVWQPAGDERTGGDLYGVWTLPGGGTAVLIGDVTGKGVEASALSAMTRFFVEARSWSAPRPSDVLEQTNAMLMGRLPGDTFVTAFLGVLRNGTLSYASAGHHPALLVREGRVSELTEHGLPLGVETGASFRESQVEIERGDLVFAYTDGLVEARGGEQIYGSERLARSVAARSERLDAPALVEAVFDDARSFAGGLSDDAVGLALRRRPA
jgi:GAF domain-containing protein